MRIELIPSANRLIMSLRDIGYEFNDAIADIIDNSVQAEATVISVNLNFDGEESYLTIADNGLGMTAKQIQEALRFGTIRSYEENDLGRYGLGLKTASLSQCERFIVASRRGEERVRINAYCWDLEHIEFTNRWEILQVEKDELADEVLTHLQKTTGTVITWERLGRLLAYKYPSGESARKQSVHMIEELKNHLGMIFHRFLSGEVKNRRIAIYVNDTRVVPWDPYSRGEKNTIKLDEISIPLEFRGNIHNIQLQPFILPPQSLYSSAKAHLDASGPQKWNKQQGLYIYRSNRIIQAGGWNGFRTNDEHSKLVRVAMFIPSQLDELFQVNVAKKYLTLPKELKESLLKILQPIIHQGQEFYRNKLNLQDGSEGINNFIPDIDTGFNLSSSYSQKQFQAESLLSEKNDSKQYAEIINNFIVKFATLLNNSSSSEMAADLQQKANPKELETLISFMKKYIENRD